MRARIVLLFIAITLAWSLVILRAAHLQILPDSRLKELKIRQYKTLIELPSRRGLISDRYDKELAVTIPAWSVYADPKEIDTPKRFVRVVSKKLGLSPLFVKEKIKNKEKRFVWLKRRLKKDFVDGIQQLKIKGLGFVEESERVYPNEKLLSQVIGFVGNEGQGLEGIEKFHDEKLRGENRKIKIERDARGRPLLVDGRVFTDIPAGYDLQLTINSDMQFNLEKELAQVVSETAADGAVGVILDVASSEILAMASAPIFDPNRPHDVNSALWRNRVITDAFEPGSTLKTFVIAGALREGTVKPGKKYYCENGHYKVGKHFIREADQHHSFGTLTVTEILALSSNVGTTKIALELGAEKARSALAAFGFGDRSGVELPGESKGILQSLPWHNHLLANISFGHGITATPLQIALAYAAIANGGVLRKPLLIKKAKHQENGEVKEFYAENVRRVLTPDQAATMRLMLNAATAKTATGFNARVSGFPVAGKTGTANKMIVGEGYAKDQYISSYAGFIPANDPKFVIFVAVDNPRNKYYGAEVVAPVFSRIANDAVIRAGLSPVLITAKSVIQKREEPTAAKVQKESILKIREMAKVFNLGEQNVTPDFKGLTLREVYNRVRGAPFRVLIRGQGVVASSFPAAGEALPVDKVIRLYLEGN